MKRIEHLLVLTILSIALAACGHKSPPSHTESAAGEPLPANAAFHTVGEGLITGRLDVVGSLQSAARVQVSARVQAYVREVRVEAGSQVKAGDVLVLLDDRDFQKQLAAAQAQLDQAETELKRAQALFEQGAIPDQALVAARSAEQSSRAQLEGARVTLSYATIVAPMDGVVTERRVESGDLASPGRILLTLYDPMRMRLEAPVPVRLISRLQLGQSVEVTLEHPSITLNGRVAEIVSEIDPRSRTQTVKVNLDQVGEPLLPGTFGRLWVQESPRPGILIPKAAVRRTGQLEYVMVATGDRMIRRLVRTGPALGDLVEILSGLQGGARIVLTNGGAT